MSEDKNEHRSAGHDGLAAAGREGAMTERRRSTDSASHAHMRNDDGFARLHQRMDDNDKMMTELLSARTESIRLHGETTVALGKMADAINLLTAETAGSRQLDKDVNGMLRILSRMNGFIGAVWKPLLFVAVLGGTIYLWGKGLVIGKEGT